MSQVFPITALGKELGYQVTLILPGGTLDLGVRKTFKEALDALELAQNMLKENGKDE